MASPNSEKNGWTISDNETNTMGYHCYSNQGIVNSRQHFLFKRSLIRSNYDFT